VRPAIKLVALAAAALIALAAAISTAPAADLWYEDNNLGRGGGMPPDFIEKFRRPETFSQATRHIRVYLMRAVVLRKLDDEFLSTLLIPYLEKNNIKLAINAGGATWGRERARDRDMQLFERLKRLGARVDYISLQSVLSKPMRKMGEEWTYPMSKRIEAVVAYTRAAKAVFPQAEIGIIDALPSHGRDYRQPYRELRDAMARGGFRLSFVHLDMPFEIPAERLYGINWRTVREVERYVENGLGVRFGFFATSRNGGHRSSKAFHDNVMAALECVSGSGGTPGDFIVASWFPHPRTTIPEDATGNDYPAMRTVLAFGRRLEQIDKAGPDAVAQLARQPEWRSLCAA